MKCARYVKILNLRDIVYEIRKKMRYTTEDSQYKIVYKGHE